MELQTSRPSTHLKGVAVLDSESLPPVRIPDRMYFRIGDVADLLEVKPYVLRYWETEFPTISPEKSQSGQRVYKRSDVETLVLIKHLLYNERYSIEGARKRIAELRKDGQLKAVRQQKAVSAHAVSGFTGEQMKRLKELALEIQTLARTPLHEVFKG